MNTFVAVVIAILALIGAANVLDFVVQTVKYYRARAALHQFWRDQRKEH